MHPELIPHLPVDPYGFRMINPSPQKSTNTLSFRGRPGWYAPALFDHPLLRASRGDRLSVSPSGPAIWMYEVRVTNPNHKSGVGFSLVSLAQVELNRQDALWIAFIGHGYPEVY